MSEPFKGREHLGYYGLEYNYYPSRPFEWKCDGCFERISSIIPHFIT
jgi:hypothetical protein